MGLQDLAFKNKFYCSSTTLKEIEDIKTSSKKDFNIKYKARKLSKLFDENNNYIVCNNSFDSVTNVLKLYGLEDSPDNRIMSDAWILKQTNPDIVFITNDISCKNIAKNIFKLDVSSVETNIEDYKGYAEIYPTDEELANIYQHLNENSLGLLTNQYVIVRNSDNEVIDTMKWNGSEYRGINYKTLNNINIGKVKPRNTEQTLAMDLLQDENIPVKVLTGKYGVGRNLCRR